jgi:hypothetical protein
MIFYEVILVVQKDKPIIEHSKLNFDQVLIWDKVYCLCIGAIFWLDPNLD